VCFSWCVVTVKKIYKILINLCQQACYGFVRSSTGDIWCDNLKWTKTFCKFIWKSLTQSRQMAKKKNFGAITLLQMRRHKEWLVLGPRLKSVQVWIIGKWWNQGPIIGLARWPEGHDPKIFSILVSLCFEKQRPKQNYCCSPKIKHFVPLKLLAWLRHWPQSADSSTAYSKLRTFKLS